MRAASDYLSALVRSVKFSPGGRKARKGLFWQKSRKFPDAVGAKEQVYLVLDGTPAGHCIDNAHRCAFIGARTVVRLDYFVLGPLSFLAGMARHWTRAWL